MDTVTLVMRSPLAVTETANSPKPYRSVAPTAPRTPPDGAAVALAGCAPTRFAGCPAPAAWLVAVGSAVGAAGRVWNEIIPANPAMVPAMTNNGTRFMCFFSHVRSEEHT